MGACVLLAVTDSDWVGVGVGEWAEIENNVSQIRLENQEPWVLFFILGYTQILIYT